MPLGNLLQGLSTSKISFSIPALFPISNMRKAICIAKRDEVSQKSKRVMMFKTRKHHNLSMKTYVHTIVRQPNPTPHGLVSKDKSQPADIYCVSAHCPLATRPTYIYMTVHYPHNLCRVGLSSTSTTGQRLTTSKFNPPPKHTILPHLSSHPPQHSVHTHSPSHT